MANNTLVDRSGTIASGGASQLLAPANGFRRYLLVQNLDPTTNLYINFAIAATTSEPSLLVPPNGGSFVMESGYIDTEQVYIISSLTGHVFMAKEGSL